MSRDTLLLIRKVKVHVPGRHGAVWKIAYADFVTAMMAFFLLLWLISSFAQDYLESLGNYFRPTPYEKPNKAGGGGLFGGSDINPQTILRFESNFTSRKSNTDKHTFLEYDSKFSGQFNQRSTGDVGSISLVEATRDVETTRQLLQKAIALLPPEHQNLKDSIYVNVSDQGVHLELVDLDGIPAFAAGSYQLSNRLKSILRLLLQFIIRLPNSIVISGFSDALGSDSNNWLLSAKRAVAVKNFLVRGGLPVQRIEKVAGYGPSFPILDYDKNAPENRRISIIFLDQQYMEIYDQWVNSSVPPEYIR